MLKEIENYIENNMKDMYKALEELKISFEEEIANVDGKNIKYNYFLFLEEQFPLVVKGLKEDMVFELENLKELYEEQRRTEVEKIRVKYLNNLSQTLR
jgi:hypothetical protein